MNWVLQGKQVFNSNEESILDRVYAKAEKHETHGSKRKNEELHWGKERGQKSEKMLLEMAHAG